MRKTIARVDLLILDDWGLTVLSATERRDLLEILEDRQLPVEHFHGVIGDLTRADAILDRLVHNAHRLALSGESMRSAPPSKSLSIKPLRNEPMSLSASSARGLE